MSLISIQPTCQQVAEVIASAIKTEVEIADRNLLRIAGTGLYRNGVLETLSHEGFVYQEVIRTGLPLVLENPGLHRLCQPCPHYGNCREMAEVAVPIEFQGEVCGVIGLVAADKAQRKRLLSDREPLMHFLTKMVDLLSVKLREQSLIRERTAAATQLETVMNYLDRGVIALDEFGQVSHANRAAARLLGMRPMVGESLARLIPGLELNLGDRTPLSTQLPWRRGNQRQTLLLTLTPILQDERFLGHVVTLEDDGRLNEALSAYANREVRFGLDAVLGQSPEILRIKDLLPQIAQGEATVLIRGESGTGKELIAQAIHSLSRRSDGPFIAVNCAAIPEALLESELFGYEAGAFTGARPGGKIGKFQLADRGTLFLDEVGDMPLHLQAKLLRVLQERYLDRVGGDRRIPINVRVLAATNHNLEELIRTSEFREDLFYRLNVIPLHLPPLRERTEDIAPLAGHFLQSYAAQSGKEILGMAGAAREAFLRYPWPGNIRELANAMEYAVTMERGDHISLQSLPPRLREPRPAPAPICGEESLNLRELEQRTFQLALERVRGQALAKERAADLLGISRATFFRKLRAYALE